MNLHVNSLILLNQVNRPRRPWEIRFWATAAAHCIIHLLHGGIDAADTFFVAVYTLTMCCCMPLWIYTAQNVIWSWCRHTHLLCDGAWYIVRLSMINTDHAFTDDRTVQHYKQQNLFKMLRKSSSWSTDFRLDYFYPLYIDVYMHPIFNSLFHLDSGRLHLLLHRSRCILLDCVHRRDGFNLPGVIRSTIGSAQCASVLSAFQSYKERKGSYTRPCQQVSIGYLNYWKGFFHDNKRVDVKNRIWNLVPTEKIKNRNKKQTVYHPSPSIPVDIFVVRALPSKHWRIRGAL